MNAKNGVIKNAVPTPLTNLPMTPTIMITVLSSNQFSPTYEYRPIPYKSIPNIIKEYLLLYYVRYKIRLLFSCPILEKQRNSLLD